MEGNEPEIFDVISQRISNWRRFGRLISIEDHVLDNIEQDFQDKHSRVNRCIHYKNKLLKHGWGFWNNRLLRFGEGRGIVDILEKQIPSLSDSITDHNDFAGAEYMFIDIFDTLSMRLRDWKPLARVLGFEEYISREIEGNDKYKTCLQEKVYRCIKKVKSTSPDWLYWKDILLKIDEKDLIEDIERLYPDLPKDKRIDCDNVDVLISMTIKLFKRF